MSGERLSPLEQAKRDVPKSWIERYHENLEVSLPSTIASFGASVFVYDEVVQHTTPTIRIIAGAISLAGIVADKASTVKVFNSANEAKEAGLIENTQVEQNPLAWNVSNSREFLRSKSLAAKDMVFVTASTFFPPVSVLAGSKILAAINNRRVAKRYDRAVEIARSSRA